jgi:hypothetical protein
VAHPGKNTARTNNRLFFALPVSRDRHGLDRDCLPETDFTEADFNEIDSSKD